MQPSDKKVDWSYLKDWKSGQSQKEKPVWVEMQYLDQRIDDDRRFVLKEVKNSNQNQQMFEDGVKQWQRKSIEKIDAFCETQAVFQEDQNNLASTVSAAALSLNDAMGKYLY